MEKAKYKIIYPQEVLQMIEENKNFYLIDVRSQQEYDMGHIDKSVNIPLETVSNKANQTFKSKDSMIVLYCRSGARSRLASSELLHLGYNQVFDLGGIISYPYDLV